MPRIGLSQGEVAEAIRLLEQAGLNPSIRMIREKIGRGSLTTIAGHKRALEAERQTGAGRIPSLPDPITESLLTSAAQYWQELVDAAQHLAEANEADAEKALQAVTRERDQVRADASALRDELEALSNRFAAVESELAERDRRIIALKEALAGAQAARDESARSRESAVSELAELKHQMDDLRRQNVEKSTEIARLTERLSARDQALAHNESALEALRATAAEHADEVDTLTRAANESARRADAAEASLVAAQEQWSAHSGRASVERAELAQLQTQLREVQDARERDVAAHAAKMAERDQRLKDLTSALNDAQVVNRLLAKQKSGAAPKPTGMDEG